MISHVHYNITYCMQHYYYHELYLITPHKGSLLLKVVIGLHSNTGGMLIVPDVA